MPTPSDLVHETATTTGTGNFTLTNADGKRSFNTAFGNGSITNVFDYFISHRTAAEWERGTGHMSAATTLVRDTVIASSNANAAVNFAAGTKDVTNDQPASRRREVLTAARTYYVRTDGSDSNLGIEDSAAGAFLTIQKAVNTVAGLDLNIYDVTIDIGDGTYAENITFKTLVGAGEVKLLGNTATPGNVVLSGSTGGHTIGSVTSTDTFVGKYSLQGMKITSSGAGRAGIAVNGAGAIVILRGNLEFGATGSHQIIVIHVGTLLNQADYTINGSPTGSHAVAAYKGLVVLNNSGAARTVTLTGTPAWSSAFALAIGTSFIRAGNMTFSGAATGTRCNVTSNSSIDTAGGSLATYFPGDVNGTTSADGEFT